MPRTVSIIILVCLCTFGMGCRSLWNFKPKHPLPPTLPKNEIDLASIIAAINQNTDNIRQLDSNVKVSMNGLPTGISGSLQMETPDRLRLQAGFLGINDLGVDIGSNQELFWIWTKTSLPGRPSTILYSRHKEFMQSAAGRQMRLHPKWIFNALGLIRFEATDKHHGPTIDRDKRLRIQSEITSDGVALTRVVKVNPKYGWIEQISLYDANRNLIAYANAQDHRYDEEQQATLPRFVQLFVYPEGGEKMELTIQITRAKINQLAVDPDKTWRMPAPPDVPSIDISSIPSGPQLQSPDQNRPPTAQLQSNYPYDRRATVPRDRGHTFRR